MPYTAAQLITFYTNIHAGLAPNPTATQLLNAYAAQNGAGALSDAATLQAVIDTADADSAVAISAYNFFTGTAPSAAGLAFLVNSTTNTTDLNDPYYTNFNITNRYINFAANLGTGAGAGATTFSNTYGALNFTQAVDLAYETIIGSTNATAAGVNPTAGKAFIASQLPYFTALANQNFPTANAATKDLIIKAEMVGYIMAEAMKANIGTYAQATAAVLADLAPDNAANLGVELLGAYAAGSVTLTSGVDVRTANVFNAPRAFTPGGTDQINSLNDDDVLTGSGTNPTLNWTSVNDADTGDQYIQPILNNIQTVNIAFAGEFGTSGGQILDLNDSSGLKAINISRMSGNLVLGGTVNSTSVPTTMSITNSSAQAGTVVLETTDSAAAGSADATSLTLSNVSVNNISIQETGQFTGTPGTTVDQGIETVTLVSTGSANKVGTLFDEDMKSLVITGGKNLTLGTTGLVTTGGVAGALVEATRYGAGLGNVAGSLTSIDGSALTAALDISIGAEATATADDTSGTNINLKVTGGTGADTFRLVNGVNATVGATINGGDGADTVQVYASVTKGSYTNVETLDVRSGQDANNAGETVTVNTALFPQLTGVTVRNEGMDTSGPGGAFTPVGEGGTFVINGLTAATSTAITVLHGTTANNHIQGTIILANVATDTTNDTLGVTIKDGINTNPRFNFTLTGGFANGATLATPFENVSIADSDTESNSVLLTNVAQHTGTLTVTGGAAGQFLNLDNTINGVATAGGATQKNIVGVAVDGKGWIDPGAGAADRVIAGTVAAGTFAGDLIVRVANNPLAGPAGSQSITTGTGNDIVIFDTITGVGQSTAGLSISDTVAGGANTPNANIAGTIASQAGLGDQLVIDGDGVAITLGASEWTNVTGFETLRLIGNAAAGTNGFGAINAYNLTLTNSFITANSTTSGGISRIVIVNDNDAFNDVVNSGAINDYGDDTAGTAQESGVTIDARSLSPNISFVYNGEEGATATADRFIMTDANINASAIIDGGAVYTGGGNGFSNLANNDVLEVRNAAVITIGDLSGVRNVGTIQFTNDTASVQSSILQLDTATIDAMVNSTEVAGAANPAGGTYAIETLKIQVQGNLIVPAAATNLTIDSTAVDVTKTLFSVTTTGGSTSVTINGAGAVVNFIGGAGADALGLNTNVGAVSPHNVDLAGGVDTVTWTGTVDSGVAVLGAAGTVKFTTGATSITHTVKNVEIMDFSGVTTVTGVNVTGSAVAETITGTNQGDVLQGAGGADTLIGGGGNDDFYAGTGIDTLTLGAGADRVIFNGDNGAGDNDIITDFVTGVGGDQLLVEAATTAGGIVAALNGASIVAIGASADNSFIVDTAGTGYATFALAEAAVEAANAGTDDYVLIFFNTTTNRVEAWADASSAAAGAGVQLATFNNITTDAAADTFLVGIANVGNLGAF